jgi:hypothetical protein
VFYKRELTGGNKSHETDPGEPRNAVQGSNRGSKEGDNHGNSNEDSSASSVHGQTVERNRDTQHSRTGDTDGEERVGDTVELLANSAENETGGIVDAIDFGVTLLELADDVVGPGGDNGDDQHADDTGDETKGVKGGGDRQNSQTDLGLHHED